MNVISVYSCDSCNYRFGSETNIHDTGEVNCCPICGVDDIHFQHDLPINLTFDKIMATI